MKGLSIHCHHDILIEYCYDYDERVKAIKRKPANEIKTRLRLFKLLPQEAIDELPKELIKANLERKKADANMGRYACSALSASRRWDKAYVEWKDKDAWHKKWCGCEEWRNGVINFPQGVEG